MTHFWFLATILKIFLIFYSFLKEKVKKLLLWILPPYQIQKALFFGVKKIGFATHLNISGILIFFAEISKELSSFEGQKL
jgi:hypothetical protein